ncbi:MAG: DNA replication protein DnaC [Motiliproteus sp.]
MLVQHLQEAMRDLDLMTAMTRLDKYRLIIIDDIGYVKKMDAETRVRLSSSPIAMKAAASSSRPTNPSAHGIIFSRTA